MSFHFEYSTKDIYNGTAITVEVYFDFNVYKDEFESVVIYSFESGEQMPIEYFTQKDRDLINEKINDHIGERALDVKQDHKDLMIERLSDE